MQCSSIASFDHLRQSQPDIEKPEGPPKRHTRQWSPTRLLRCLLWLSAFAACYAGSERAASAQSGIASVYSYSATRTASGARASPSALTAAHRSLPFGTLVRVTNTRNGRSVVVRINDRGPFVHGRIIDVTPAAAQALGFSGIAHVTLDVVGRAGKGAL